MLCDKKFPARVKGKFFKVVSRPALLYGLAYWAVKKTHEQKMQVAEMRMLRWMCCKTMMDQIKNLEFREKLGMAPLSAKMHENRVRWFGLVLRCLVDYLC